MVSYDSEYVIVKSRLFASYYERVLLDIRNQLRNAPIEDVGRLTLMAKHFRDELRAIQREGERWMNYEIPPMFQRGATFAEERLRLLGITPVSSLFVQPHAGAIAVVVDAMRRNINEGIRLYEGSLLNFVSRMKQATPEKRAVLREIAQGITLGESRTLVSSRIEERLAARAVGGWIKVGEKNLKLNTYAELLARTQMRVAHSRGTETRLVSNGIEYVMISLHGSKCDICAPLEGKVFCIGKSDGVYPPLSILPNEGCPLHPNCLHVELPFIVELANKQEIGESKFDSDTFPFDTKWKAEAA